ncbi:MAG: tetratricopeptide repeat protein [Bacteroidia bacterium]|nr:tetratricopeptide repeat protein [Bacteroidia bacterium]
MTKNKLNTAKQKHPVKTESKIIREKKSFQAKWLWTGAVLLLTFISFYPTIHCGFTTWDDPLYVTENSLIKNFSFDNICHIFSLSGAVSLNYHPLTILSLAVDYHFAGQDPSWFHFTNLLIHLLNTLLVFFFAYRLSGRKLAVGIFVSLFFGIHPMHVESVAWVSERKDVLYTFFFVAALLTYLKYIESPKAKYLLFTFLLFVLSVLSKAVAVIFPLVMFLIDFYKGRKITIKSLMEKLPFLTVSVVFGVIALHIQSKGAIARYETFSLFKHICFGFYGYFNYFWKFLLPVNLSSFYPYPILDQAQIAYPFSFYFSAFSGFLILILTGALFFFRKEKMKLLAFGACFCFLTILLVLQFLSVGQVIMADRYSYVPYIGLLFPIGVLLNDLKEKRPSLKNMIVVPILAIALVFSYLTHERIKVWKDTETLWTDVIEKYPYPPWLVEPAYSARGKYYAGEKKDFDKALSDFNTLISMKTKNHFIYNNLGSIYGTKGVDAEKAGDRSLAVTYFTKATGYFQTSLSLDSNDAGTYANRATLYIYLQKYELAAADYSKALKFDPENKELTEKRAYAEFQDGKWKEAISDYDRLMSAGNSKTYMFLYRGTARLKAEMFREAIDDFNNLLQIEPRNAKAYYNLAVCYFHLHEPDAARANLEKARQSGFMDNPDHLELY